jgi:S1-C subfamily serine protease
VLAVKILGVEKGSPAAKSGVLSGETLISLNGNDIIDVLDYRFYQNERTVEMKLQSEDGQTRCVTVKNWLVSMIQNWHPDHIGLEGI